MKSLERSIRRLVLRLVGLLHPRQHYSADQLPLDSFKRLLIVRQHDQLGDLLITTPAIRALRKKFPSSYIAIVVREYTAPIVEQNPYVDEVIVFYEKLGRWNISKLIKFWKSLRNENGFDCAVMLNTISRSFTSDMIALMSRAKYIIGPDHHSHDPSLPEMIYNVIVPRASGAKHEIERNLDIVRALGADASDREYDLVLTDDEMSNAERIYQSLNMSPGRTIVGVHFGTLDPLKCLPLDTLARIIDWMIENCNADVILIVSPNEVERRSVLLSELHNDVHSAPFMPLRVMAAFMRHLDLFLCNDTGTLHIASSQRVPTVSFHSLSDPVFWKPPHPRHIAVRAPDGLIGSITIEQVKEAVVKALK